MNTLPPIKQKATTNRWYLRPAVWVSSALCLGGVAYAVIMNLQQKEQETACGQLRQDIVIQSEKVKQAQNRRMEVKVNPEYRKYQLECHQNNISSWEERIRNTEASIEKLKSLDCVKEYLKNGRQLKELKEQNQTLYQQVEEKRKRYRTLEKEALS